MRPEPTAAVAAWIGERDAQMYLTAVSEAELLYGVAIMPTGKRRSALEAAMKSGGQQRAVGDGGLGCPLVKQPVYALAGFGVVFA